MRPVRPSSPTARVTSILPTVVHLAARFFVLEIYDASQNGFGLVVTSVASWSRCSSTVEPGPRVPPLPPVSGATVRGSAFPAAWARMVWLTFKSLTAMSRNFFTAGPWRKLRCQVVLVQ